MAETRPAPTGSATVRGHIWVGGVVQGVGFRLFAERVARRSDVTGLARNLPDGRVEIIAEGPAAAVERFVADVRRGPAGAVVREVRVEWETPEGMRGFLML